MRSRDSGKGLLVVALVALCLGVLAAVLWLGRVGASSQAERDDLELFLDASAAGWAEVTEQFLSVPENAAQTISRLEQRMENDEARLALLVELIRERDALNSAYIGYPDGSFLFAGRSDDAAPGGFRTRSIDVSDGTRSVMLTWTDSELNVLREVDDPDDLYDPRERPWYLPVFDGADRNWTAPYIFDSSQQPGITHSASVVDSNGQVAAVVGVDIRLTELGEFLDELRPGANGTAMVIDSNSALIARSTHGGETDVVEGEIPDEDPELGSFIQALRDGGLNSVLARADDGLRTTVVRSAGAGGDWYLAVEAVDEDFLSNDRAANAFEVGAIGLGVGAGVAGLGYLMLRYVRRLRRQADRDELTGVLNRRAIKRHIGQLMDHQRNGVVVGIIDLDLFKKVNDQHGHLVGDAVLVAMAKRIEAFAYRHRATAGRLGGDEFIVFAEHELPWEELSRVLGEAAEIDGIDFTVTASVGVAVSDASHVELASLLRDADHALFEAKRAGGDHHQRYADQISRTLG